MKLLILQAAVQVAKVPLIRSNELIVKTYLKIFT